MLAVSKSKYHQTQTQLNREEQLILDAKEDRRKFAALYDKYYEQIYMYIFQRIDTTEQCQDLVSQVFLKAMTNLDRYEYRGVPFSSWLYRIAQNELNQAYRGQKNKRVVSVESDQLVRMASEVLEEEDDDSEERMKRMREAMAELSGDDLSIIELRFFEQRPFKEVAEILGITENNAKVKVYRILDKMKKYIGTIKA